MRRIQLILDMFYSAQHFENSGGTPYLFETSESSVEYVILHPVADALTYCTFSQYVKKSLSFPDSYLKTIGTFTYCTLFQCL